jgi:hypothetical protein
VAVGVYVRAFLPPAAGPAFGCPDEDATAFILDGGATTVLACASAPANTFSAYILRTSRARLG